ncbi:MAG: hypothetical protein KAR20_21945 [Candidatus Heimdallarchaeota archaeon]|nr:hypothetical protein [Candidatus Heimdallarchaeota archaeon]
MEDEQPYVSSFNFLGKVNSFKIGNGLIGLHIFSFDFMKEGSAQAAAGRDLFFVYNAEKKNVSENVLEFGITKQRNRYMGCLSAKTSHFILADVDTNGLIDIGCVKERLRCEEFSDPVRDLDGISGPFYSQDLLEWYVFEKNFWYFEPSKLIYMNYIDLPLIDIRLTPIDFFGFVRWGSYDPNNWNRSTKVNYYPNYRLQLIRNRDKHK